MFAHLHRQLVLLSPYSCLTLINLMGFFFFFSVANNELIVGSPCWKNIKENGWWVKLRGTVEHGGLAHNTYLSFLRCLMKLICGWLHWFMCVTTLKCTSGQPPSAVWLSFSQTITTTNTVTSRYHHFLTRQQQMCWTENDSFLFWGLDLILKLRWFCVLCSVFWYIK